MITAEDMKCALKSCGSVKACRVAVVELDTLKQTGIVKWDGINFCSDFKYEVRSELNTMNTSLFLEILEAFYDRRHRFREKGKVL